MGEHKAPESPKDTPSLQDLNGVWVLQKHLSTNIPSILNLQKIPFLLRKAITSPYTPIHLHITTYTTTTPGTNEQKIHLDLVQRTPGLELGMKLVPVIEDRRVLDWVEAWHEDGVFGRVRGRSRVVFGVEGEGRRMPDVGVCVDVRKEKEGEVERFLRGESGDCDGVFVFDCGAEGEDGDGGYWVQTLEISEKAGWSAETVWGFEMVDGQRLLTSRVVVVDGKGNYQLGRCVFGLLSRGD